MLEARNLKKSFKGIDRNIEVLNGVTINVSQGERLAVTGRNGTGKSTLLRILAGQLKPDSGDIKLQKNVKVLYLAQASSDYTAPNLSVLEHISLGFVNIRPSSFRSLLTAERQKKVIEIFETFGIPLARRINTFVGNLSGGERQLVAIATLIAMRPNLLLLDEFTSSLDPETTSVVIRILIDYMGFIPSAIVFVTHDFDLVHEFSTRAFNIDSK